MVEGNDDKDFVFKADAMISHFLHIPFPEQLDDVTWSEKLAQAFWLMKSGLIAPKIKI